MNATREELLQNLTYVQQMMAKIINVYSNYIQLERNFRTAQAGIETDGVVNRAKLVAVTVGCTVAAFILLIAMISSQFESVIVLAIAAGVVVINRNKKSKLKTAAVLVIAVLLIGTIWNLVRFMNLGIAIILVFLLGIVILLEWFFITQKNKSVANYNKKVEENNAAVQAQRVSLYNQYEALRREMLNRSANWFPPDYYNVEAVNFFIDAIRNYRANTVQEMVNLFEQTAYQKEMLAYQRQQSQQLGQLIQGQQEIKGQLRYANMINTASLFQLQSINSGVQQLHSDAQSIHSAVGGVQSSIGKLSSEVTKLRNKIK